MAELSTRLEIASRVAAHLLARWPQGVGFGEIVANAVHVADLIERAVQKTPPEIEAIVKAYMEKRSK